VTQLKLITGSRQPVAGTVTGFGLDSPGLYATVKNGVAQFKLGDFSICDAPRPGRPKTVTTPEINFFRNI
jgi:hypothetical protein